MSENRKRAAAERWVAAVNAAGHFRNMEVRGAGEEASRRASANRRGRYPGA